MVFIKEWHAESPSRVLEAFNSKEEGLTNEQAEARLAKFGLNETTSKSAISKPKLLLNQFRSFVSLLLVIAAVFSYIFGYQKESFFIDTIIILIVLVLKVIVGFLLELKYFGFFEKIQQNSIFTSTVKRGGEKEKIEREKIVPGDIIYVEEGDIIPADARILDSNNLKTDESLLTNGSKEVSKSAKSVSKKAKPEARKNFLYAGTTVIKGFGWAVIVKTGNENFLSGIKDTNKASFFQKTNLQQKTNHISEVGMALMLILSGVTFISILLLKEELIISLMYLLSLSIAVLPEGAMAVSSISIAFGASYLMNKNVLVRNPSAIENLACADVICTDKSGTLTLEEMTVREVYANKELVEVSGHGYEPVGKFTDSKNRQKHTRSLFQLFCCSILCNNSELEKDETGWFVKGNPLEGALQVLAKKGGVEKEQLEKEMPRIKENPFDSNRKLMSTVHKFKNKEVVFVKGAPEVLLKKCSKIYLNGYSKKLTQKERNETIEKKSQMAENGLKVIALAYKTRDKRKDEENLVFLGIVGMLDPPRRELISSIEKCKNAGISVKIITKDSKETALAVAKELGIGNCVMTGEDVGKAGKEFKDTVEAVNVYAGVLPEQKLKIVRALKKAGHSVAMLGDDAKEKKVLEVSDVGVAKGKEGTDASRKYSDVIISDDSFDSLIDAVEESRGKFDNIKKSITYLFSSSVSIFLVVLAGIMLSLFFNDTIPFAVLEPIHLILLFFFLGLVILPGLCAEPPTPSVMKEKPRKKSENLIKKSNIFDIILTGIIITAGTSFIALIGLESSIYQASTMAFATLTFFLVFNSVNFKNIKQSIFPGFFKNPLLLFLIAISIFVLLVLIYTPLLYENLFFTPLELKDWLIVILTSFSVIVLMEAKKFISKIFIREVPSQQKVAAD